MTQTTKHTRRIFRKHRQGLSKISLHLSRPDITGIEQARKAYADQIGLSLSSSLILSLAIAALNDETARGELRKNPEMYVAKEQEQ